jgi:hypothetical protein
MFYILSYIRGLDLMIKFIGPLYNLLQHRNHYLRLDTPNFWSRYTNPLLQLNSQLLLASCYIALGRTTEKTHPLPSNGCPLLLHIHCRGMCLLSRCPAMGICITICMEDSLCCSPYSYLFPGSFWRAKLNRILSFLIPHDRNGSSFWHFMCFKYVPGKGSCPT